LIRKVLGRLNPQGIRTYPFKVPTKKELSHDFLWRIHAATPAAGMISVFNRSHYEDVLVVRVEDIVPKSVWSKRFDHINHFESMLSDRGTRIVKIYLHISPEEQLQRFKERLDRPEKHWKLNPADYDAHAKWAAYRDAYEDVFQRCNPDHAPWYVIPADQKWYRDAAITGILLQTLQDMNPQFPRADVDLNMIRHLYEDAAARMEDSK
ncbi:MAG: PPK2 family polyphosphate kinase, partial [Planctomycetota bacterium]